MSTPPDLNDVNGLATSADAIKLQDELNERAAEEARYHSVKALTDPMVWVRDAQDSVVGTIQDLAGGQPIGQTLTKGARIRGFGVIMCLIACLGIITFLIVYASKSV